MRPLLVVVPDELTHEVIQMPEPDGDEVVQALALDRPDPALGKGVHQRRVGRDPLGAAAASGQCGVEPRPELAVAVADQDRGSFNSLAFDLREEDSRFVGTPRSRRTQRRGPGDDATRPYMDEEEDVRCPPAGPRQHRPGEEVAGPEGPRVRLEELVQARLAPLGRRLDPVLEEDGAHRGAGDGRDTELLEFAQDAAVPPTRGSPWRAG